MRWEICPSEVTTDARTCRSRPYVLVWTKLSQWEIINLHSDSKVSRIGNIRETVGEGKNEQKQFPLVGH